MNKEGLVDYAEVIYDELKHLDTGKSLSMVEVVHLVVAIVARMKADGLLRDNTLH